MAGRPLRLAPPSNRDRFRGGLGCLVPADFTYGIAWRIVMVHVAAFAVIDFRYQAFERS